MSVSLKHTYEVRPWEKDLQRIFDESNSTKLTAMSKESVTKYLSALPSTPGTVCVAKRYLSVLPSTPGMVYVVKKLLWVFSTAGKIAE